ncbi:MAG: AI-2E family transporter [Oscillospiraceae bacterium]|nr:AI-2E family transporter [Oscillospiraceae bacterium]
MKIKFNSRYNTVSAYVVFTFTICLMVLVLIFKFSIIQIYLNKILKILAPIIWGLVTAYLLNPLLKFVEKYISKLTNRKKERRSLTRGISIAVVMIIFFLLAFALIANVVPEILNSIKNILNNMQSYLDNSQKFLQGLLEKLNKKSPELLNFINSQFSNIESVLLSLANTLQPQIENIFSKDGLIASLTGGAWSIIMGLKDFLIGIIVSIYLLFSKEKFAFQSKKTIYALFNEKNSSKILRITNDANNKFINFLVGKAIDSFIIGIIAVLYLTIRNMPYASLIGIIIGVTNMIPFFGPFFGAVPSAVLILLSNPERTLEFVIFVLVLQQFDGNILGPKILGNQLGISAFWILVSILIGGGIFGFVGMILAVPFFAVIYPVFVNHINEKLKSRRNLPPDLLPEPVGVPVKEPSETKKKDNNK